MLKALDPHTPLTVNWISGGVSLLVYAPDSDTAALALSLMSLEASTPDGSLALWSHQTVQHHLPTMFDDEYQIRPVDTPVGVDLKIDFPDSEPKGTNQSRYPLYWDELGLSKFTNATLSLTILAGCPVDATFYVHAFAHGTPRSAQPLKRCRSMVIRTSGESKIAVPISLPVGCLERVTGVVEFTDAGKLVRATLVTRTGADSISVSTSGLSFYWSGTFYLSPVEDVACILEFEAGSSPAVVDFAILDSHAQAYKNDV